MTHRTLFNVVLIIAAGLLLTIDAQGAPIAKISSYQGDAVIHSGSRIIPVTEIGQPVNSGDFVQTKKGEVEITFSDGAITKIRPHTNGLIQEREEKGGFWLFKTSNPVRRITCFVGKLWFKSGTSDRKNYLQTPTAVCGIRGSDGDLGYDNINTFLNMYSGEAGITGKVLRGFFEDPGVGAATKSQVYQSLQTAYTKSQEAQATGQVLYAAKAKVDVIQVVKVAATELIEKSPDPAVKEIAALADVTADASIAAAKADVAVETIKEQKAVASAAAVQAQAQADEEAAAKAQEATRIAEAALAAAETAAQAAASAAEEAKTAADAGEFETAKAAARTAESLSEEAAQKAEESTKATEQVMPPSTTSTEAVTSTTEEEVTTTEDEVTTTEEVVTTTEEETTTSEEEVTTTEEQTSTTEEEAATTEEKTTTTEVTTTTGEVTTSTAEPVTTTTAVTSTTVTTSTTRQTSSSTTSTWATTTTRLTTTTTTTTASTTTTTACP
ncbi:MAG: hypothetical protein M0P57_07130 [Syntrophales bacterium]|nr:hypothetical protein [Syntrophales bacterium]MDY0043825.1 hypothetical protein [Syntrophales bacterium]